MHGAVAYGRKVSTEKSKIVVNTSADITMNGQKREEMTNFKQLGAILSKDGTSIAEVRSELQWYAQR